MPKLKSLRVEKERLMKLARRMERVEAAKIKAAREEKQQKVLKTSINF